MLELFETVFTDIYNGIGVSYWEGCWISVNKSQSTTAETKWSENEPYWEEYGCGWTSKYAYYYSSDHYEYKNGGCVIENEAFFDETGHPFDSLTAFKTIRDTDYSSVSSKVVDITNGDFETDYAATGWTYDSSVIGEWPVEDDGVNSTHSLKWYSEGTIEFDISQDVSGNSGSFTFSMEIRGGKTDTAYVYVIIDGVEYKSSNASFSAWNQFETLSVTFSQTSSQTVIVGLHVESNTTGTWGNADNATLVMN